MERIGTEFKHSQRQDPRITNNDMCEELVGEEKIYGEASEAVCI